MGIVFFLIPLILRAARRGTFGGSRKDLHHTNDKVIPRFGGLALALAFIGVQIIISLLYSEPQEVLRERMVILLSSVAVFGLGFWDDIRPIGAKKKLAGQIIIALVVCCFGHGIQKFRIPFTETIISLHGWGLLVTVAWLVVMTNLINLVDGVDGLAGGICLMLMSLLAYQGTSTMQFVAAGMAGALLAFLWFNFPPARIYMGDGGAYFLGFQIGMLSIASSQKGTIVAALVAPLFVLALPILDVALAILRRGLRGLPVLQPDKRHIHHHLLSMGLSRRRVVLSIYGVTLVFLVMGFAAFWSRGQLVPVLLGLGALLLLLCAGKLSFSREWFAVGKVLGNSLSIRQEVQYGLVLVRWLTMEGDRGNSIECLWSDLVFVAQRLGFTGIRLSLEDGERLWSQAETGGPIRVARHELQGGRCGILELTAPAIEDGSAEDHAPLAPEEADVPGAALSDPKLFVIMSELLAEGWIRATRRWQHRTEPMRFDSKAPAHSGRTFLCRPIHSRAAVRTAYPRAIRKQIAEGTVSS